MSTSDFINPLQTNTQSLSGIRSGQAAGDKQIQRQQRLAELKSQVETGAYNIDFQQLSNQILKSGILSND